MSPEPRVVAVRVGPPFIGRRDQFMGFSFAERLRPGAQIGPAMFQLGERLRMNALGFGGIARGEAALFLALAEEGTQVVRNPLTEPINAGLGMLPGTGHCEGHVVPPLCTTPAV